MTLDDSSFLLQKFNRINICNIRLFTENSFFVAAMHQLVIFQLKKLWESLGTVVEVAPKDIRAKMDSQMLLEVITLCISFLTIRTLMWFDASVRQHVPTKMTACDEIHFAYFTGETFLVKNKPFKNEDFKKIENKLTSPACAL